VGSLLRRGDPDGASPRHPATSLIEAALGDPGSTKHGLGTVYSVYVQIVRPRERAVRGAVWSGGTGSDEDGFPVRHDAQRGELATAGR
jgi:hypothetical protein